ncbi:sialidase family protein [Terrabacter sp. NPDC080008]|uniref:sialidase family protein n=1 Tax=Terrabacter sp. NPDC080008 TaxID=3155176 RepID=UPI00344D87E8
MAHRPVLTAALVSVATALAGAAVAVAAPPGDVLVSNGSRPTPFSQNKQNEPAVAIDAANPNVVVAGSNDEIDLESCAAGDPSTCPFTPGVGVSGVYFSFDSGASWTQPTYNGWTARDCLGPAACTPHPGPIGTLPKYYESGLVSDGDPAVAFGPRMKNGTFSWANGSRLYYANLTSNFNAKRTETFKGAEAIAVSRTDDVAAAAAGQDNAWMSPVLISKQSATTFSDKEQVWADNASSSRYFGNVYVCWASFRSNSKGQALPTPLNVARSTDGGSTWTQKQVGPATDNRNNSQPDGCTVRTDSLGNVYVFGIGTRGGASYQMMYKSTDGGAHWAGPTLITTVTAPGVPDPVLGRPVMDGVAGARVDLAAGPSVDIANGAPSGAGATNEIVMTWSDGRAGLNNEQLMLESSTDGGASWVGPTAVPLRTLDKSTATDRPVYTAPALSPNGKDLYVTVNAFTTPYQPTTTTPRNLVGEVIHADVAAGVPTGWKLLHRGADGDPRGTSQNGLTAEFLGDYVYTAATDSGAVGVWNDARNAADCPAIDAYRASLYTSTPATPPDVLASCPATFGNSDIFGAHVLDPTP